MEHVLIITGYALSGLLASGTVLGVYLQIADARAVSITPSPHDPDR